jgi:hypothetical protein
MKALRARCIVVLALAGLASACGSQSAAPEGTSENASAPLTPITSVDFENYPPGPLGAPWSVSQKEASAISIATTADHGKVLALAPHVRRPYQRRRYGLHRIDDGDERTVHLRERHGRIQRGLRGRRRLR